MNDDCDSCGKEPDFVLEDGTAYCAKCIIQEAKEVLERKKNPVVCPLCKTKQTDLMFHLATSHTKEELSSIICKLIDTLGDPEIEFIAELSDEHYYSRTYKEYI